MENNQKHSGIGCAVILFLAVIFIGALIHVLFSSQNKTVPAPHIIFTPSAVTPRPTPFVTPTPRTSSTPYFVNNHDPYDIGDYSDTEEFYEYNYDDFFDYYDAEDYYNDHQ